MMLLPGRTTTARLRLSLVPWWSAQLRVPYWWPVIRWWCQTARAMSTAWWSSRPPPVASVVRRPVSSRGVLFLGRTLGTANTAKLLPSKTATKPGTIKETILFRGNIVGPSPTTLHCVICYRQMPIAISHVSLPVIGLNWIPDLWIPWPILIRADRRVKTCINNVGYLPTTIFGLDLILFDFSEFNLT